MALNTDWKEFLNLLVSSNVEFLIIGAWARAQYGEPRMTGDIDFWIKVELQNAKKMVDVIEKFGFASLGLTEDDFMANDGVIHLGIPPRRIYILTKASGLDFDQAWNNRNVGELDGVPVSFISREDFVTNKKAVGRPKDLADIDAILGSENN